MYMHYKKLQNSGEGHTDREDSALGESSLLIYGTAVKFLQHILLVKCYLENYTSPHQINYL